MEQKTIRKIDLQKVDEDTPKYKFLLENNLSVQERGFIVGIVRSNKGSQVFTTKELKSTRIQQTNHRNSILTRLCEKGIINRINRGIYVFVDKNLLNYIKVRCCRYYEE